VLEILSFGSQTRVTATLEPETTQQSGQTPDKEVENKNITVYVNGYFENDPAGMLSPPTV